MKRNQSCGALQCEPVGREVKASGHHWVPTKGIVLRGNFLTLCPWGISQGLVFLSSHPVQDTMPPTSLSPACPRFQDSWLPTRAVYTLSLRMTLLWHRLCQAPTKGTYNACPVSSASPTPLKTFPELGIIPCSLQAWSTHLLHPLRCLSLPLLPSLFSTRSFSLSFYLSLPLFLFFN